MAVGSTQILRGVKVARV